MSKKSPPTVKVPQTTRGSDSPALGIMADDLDALWEEYLQAKGLKYTKSYKSYTNQVKLYLIRDWIQLGKDID